MEPKDFSVEDIENQPLQQIDIDSNNNERPNPNLEESNPNLEELLQVREGEAEEYFPPNEKESEEQEKKVPINEIPVPSFTKMANADIYDQFEKSQKVFKSKVEKFLPNMEDYFITPDNFDLILETLEKRYPKEGETQLLQWKLEDIRQILGKILIPDSVKPTLDNAKVLAQYISEMEGDQVDILELCTGAGISAMMTWKEIKKANPDKRCSIITTDDALQSLLVAETLLSLKGVPVRLVSKQEIQNNSVFGFDGVSLVLSEASDIVNYYALVEKNFSAVISDHGINYFEKDHHHSIVNQIPNLLKKGGVFQVCALENEPKMSLNYKKMALQILSFGKDLSKTIPDAKNPYEIEEVDGLPYVRAINSAESAGLYMLLREDLKNLDIISFGKYLKSIIGVAKVTKKLAKDVKSPISYTASLLEGSKIIPNDKDQKLSIARSLLFVK